MAKRGTDDILAVVSDIYDAALDPLHWPVVVSRLAVLFDSNTAALLAADRRFERTNVAELIGYDATAAMSYQDYFAPRDILFQDALTRPSAEIYLDTMYPDQRAIERSEIHNDLFRPHAAERLMAGFVLRDSDRLSVLSLRRRASAGEFSEDDAKVLSLLLPHLRRAFQLRRHFFELEHAADAFAEPLERLSIGTVLIDAGSTILRMNRPAERMVSDITGLSTWHGRLVFTGSAGARIAGLIDGAVKVARGDGLRSGGLLHLSRPSGRAPYQLLVSPLPRTSRWPENAAVLLLLKDPEDRSPPPEAALRALFGLTPREAALASLLTDGQSLDAAAGTLGMTKETARFHLRHVLGKTATRRQSELVITLQRSLATLADKI